MPTNRLEDHNNKISRVFSRLAMKGLMVWAVIDTLRFINHNAELDLQLFEPINYFIGHVKGAGQAVCYGSWLNTITNKSLEKKSLKKSKEDLNSHKYQDYSLRISLGLLVAGLAWEKFTQYYRGGVFDTQDMLMYAVGCCVLTVASKHSVSFVSKDYPDLLKQKKLRKFSEPKLD